MVRTPETLTVDEFTIGECQAVVRACANGCATPVCANHCAGPVAQINGLSICRLMESVQLPQRQPVANRLHESVMAMKRNQIQGMLKVADVAVLLNVSNSLVYDLAASGKLTPYRPGNGRGCLRFKPEDVEAYLEGCRVETGQPRKAAPRPRLKHLRLS